MSKKKKEYICKCYKVTKKDMKDRIQDGVIEYKKMQKELKIGTSCSSCKKRTKKKFEKYLKKYQEQQKEEQIAA